MPVPEQCSLQLVDELSEATIYCSCHCLQIPASHVHLFPIHKPAREWWKVGKKDWDFGIESWSIQVKKKNLKNSTYMKTNYPVNNRFKIAGCGYWNMNNWRLRLWLRLWANNSYRNQLYTHKYQLCQCPPQTIKTCQCPPLRSTKGQKWPW